MPSHQLRRSSSGTAPALRGGALFRPELALTTVSWIAALALLAVNDHVLKHTGALPGWLTGKLSDFAGLYVAPALLATLLRTRSRASLAACHLAVGAVFAAINLDPGCAALCVRALNAVGIHWRIVSDAEDLIALPALLASFHWLGAAMTRDHVVERATRRAQQALAVAGLACCMATSDDWDETIGSAGPHLHNPTNKKVDVLVRSLRATVTLDCDAVEMDPGAMLPDAAFDPAIAYELDPFENLGTTNSNDRSCGALLVSGSRLSPVLLFWRPDQVTQSGVPFTYKHEKDWLPGAVVLQPGHAGVEGYKSIGGDFVYAIERGPRDVSESCALPDPALRPAVSADMPLGLHTVLAADEGADGCVALRFGPAQPSAAEPDLAADLDGGVAEDDSDAGAGAAPVEMPEPTESPEPVPSASGLPASYVCVPPGMFPFERGDQVKIDLTQAGLHIARMHRDGSPIIELFVTSLGASTFTAHLDIDAHARADCEYQQRAGCAETAVAAEVEVTAPGAHLTLRGGELPQHVTVNGADVELAMPFSQWRAVVDSRCARGNLAPGNDSVLVAVVRWEGT